MGYLAQGFNSTINLVPPAQSGFQNLTNISFSTLVSAGIQILLVVTALILIFIILGGGIAVIVSGGGNAQGAAKGRQAVTAALIGLIIVFGAWAILQLIEIFFHVRILSGLNLL